ncbi:ABC transporter substrate-binding protein [Nonomuraea sp. NPDC050663]|uniref:ABC transporter substrate-binding protein n=1 Tax=Nonomuraea sp. NPDC050663 TaxID=3364370 RepID=UPI0037A6FDE6
MTPDHPLPRRGFLAATGAMLFLAGCGTSQGASESTGTASSGPSQAAGPWSYTDDRGKKIELPQRPTRIVTQVSAGAALWDFGVRPIGLFGPHKLADGGRDPEAGEIDVSTVQTIGNVWDEFNIEKYISLQPELLVSGMYIKDQLWYVPEKSKEQIEAVAPTVGINFAGRSGEEVIGKYSELAGLLGADLGAPAITEAKARYDKALAELKAFAAAQGELKILFAGASPDLFYICHPPEFPDLKLVTEGAGVKLIVPETVDQGGYYESISWEKIDKYAADALFIDARAQSMKVEEMAKKPTWGKLPAVKAGQVYPWRAEARYSYQGYAIMLEELVANLKKVKRVL